MTYEEMIKKAQSYKMRGKPKNDEHRIQSACVRWFRLKYPKLKNVLFAVPNGGRRDAITGARLKEEGGTHERKGCPRGTSRADEGAVYEGGAFRLFRA